jgi:hypothetical protein
MFVVFSMAIPWFYRLIFPLTYHEPSVSVGRSTRSITTSGLVGIMYKGTEYLVLSCEIDNIIIPLIQQHYNMKKFKYPLVISGPEHQLRVIAHDLEALGYKEDGGSDSKNIITLFTGPDQFRDMYKLSSAPVHTWLRKQQSRICSYSFHDR